MRRLIVLSFVTLDGIIQAPGGPNEDTSGGFRYGGWTFPFSDDVLDDELHIQMNHEFDLLLGRKTYEIFAGYWPYQDTEFDPIGRSLNRARKYVISTTLEKAEWNNSIIIRENIPDEIRKLKLGNGPEIQVHGSANLIQTLWQHDLVDELWLKIFPVAVGSGKRLFENGNFAGGFELSRSAVSSSGVIIAYYVRAGEVKTGSF
jgi:dihydrofolate reductase